ncbi:MAG: molybdopterin-guanine dinucleotide biosynthesis protein MobA, partial [Cyclobacteriaceae bacterium]
MILKESNKHQKHAKIARPDMGDFGRNELGFMGTSCQRIQQLARDIIKNLCANYHLAYVDADHKEGDRLMAGEGEENSLMKYPGTRELRDKIVYKRLDINQSNTSIFDQRQWLVKQDLVLVNANHFPSKCQVLIIDPDKSLEKKLDRLTDVQ